MYMSKCVCYFFCHKFQFFLKSGKQIFKIPMHQNHQYLLMHWHHPIWITQHNPDTANNPDTKTLTQPGHQKKLDTNTYNLDTSNIRASHFFWSFSCVLYNTNTQLKSVSFFLFGGAIFFCVIEIHPYSGPIQCKALRRRAPLNSG